MIPKTDVKLKNFDFAKIFGNHDDHTKRKFMYIGFVMTCDDTIKGTYEL